MEPIKGKIQCEFKEIAGLLRDLPDKFIVQDVRKVQRDQWDRVSDEAKRLVPVDTGRLQEMIMNKAGYARSKGVVFSTVGLRRIRKKERIKIQARKAQGKARKSDALEYDAWYGVFVEFGTRKMQKEPYLRPAFDKLYRPILSDYTDELKARLERRLDKLNSAPKRKI